MKQMNEKPVNFLYELNFTQALNLLVAPIVACLKDMYPRFRKAFFNVDIIEYDYTEDSYTIDFEITLEDGEKDWITVKWYCKENKWVVIE